MTDCILNNECIAYLTIFLAGTLSIILFPIFLAKFIMKFREGYQEKNEKLLRNSLYFLFSAGVTLYMIIRMFSL